MLELLLYYLEAILRSFFEMQMLAAIQLLARHEELNLKLIFLKNQIYLMTSSR